MKIWKTRTHTHKIHFISFWILSFVRHVLLCSPVTYVAWKALEILSFHPDTVCCRPCSDFLSKTHSFLWVQDIVKPPLLWTQWMHWWRHWVNARCGCVCHVSAMCARHTSPASSVCVCVEGVCMWRVCVCVPVQVWVCVSMHVCEEAGRSCNGWREKKTSARSFGNRGE